MDHEREEGGLAAAPAREEADLNLDMAPFEEEVRVHNRATRQVDTLVLREAGASDSKRWRAATFRALSGRAEGKPSDGLADLDVLLVSLCLWKQDAKAEGGWRQVGTKYVDECLTHKQVKALFKKIKAVSDLDERDDTDDELEKKIADLQKKLEDRRKNAGR